MKNKGFTLIEITAVVLILGVIFLISFPTLSNILKKSEKDQTDVDNQNIIMAAKTYINLHKDNYDFSEGVNQVVYLNDLVEEDLLDNNNYSDSMAVVCEIQNKKQMCKVNEFKSATNDLIKKANKVNIKSYNGGNTHEMYTFNHEETKQIGELTDYRYIGNDPYNYVTFNNELWRIIGVFTVEDESGHKEQRIKLIKNEALDDKAWDYDSRNAWEMSSLNSYLNNDYYNSLSDESKKMIADTKYYLGAKGWDSDIHYGSASDMYTWERGVEVYEGRSDYWIGKIGLMYPSDYAYTFALGIDSECYNGTYSCSTTKAATSFLYNNADQWLISHDTYKGYLVVYIDGSGYIYNDEASFINGIRPTVYLTTNIQLDKGTGKEDDPYTLKIG